MNKYLINQWGRTAHDAQVKELFGLPPKAKWPVQGMPERHIQGIHCWVLSLKDQAVGRRRPAPGMTLRAMCHCPVCGQTMPIGRLHQHSKVHP